MSGFPRRPVVVGKRCISRPISVGRKLIVIANGSKWCRVIEYALGVSAAGVRIYACQRVILENGIYMLTIDIYGRRSASWSRV